MLTTDDKSLLLGGTRIDGLTYGTVASAAGHQVLNFRHDDARTPANSFHLVVVTCDPDDRLGWNDVKFEHGAVFKVIEDGSPILIGELEVADDFDGVLFSSVRQGEPPDLAIVWRNREFDFVLPIVFRVIRDAPSGRRRLRTVTPLKVRSMEAMAFIPFVSLESARADSQPATIP